MTTEATTTDEVAEVETSGYARVEYRRLRPPPSCAICRF